MDWATALGFVESHTPQHVLAIRLVLAAFFGGMIGFEREASNYGSAGLRTHILIATVACLFTLLTFEIYRTALEGGSNPDPIRAIEATTAGIAFLGAGAIFQARGSVRGITTGAGMWLAGAVGVTTALGYYFVVFGVALFAVIVLAALKYIAHRWIGGDDDAAPQDRERKPRKTGESAQS